MRHMTIAAENAMTRPSLNGSEIKCGKNSVPVTFAALSFGNCEITLGAPFASGALSGFSIGL